MSISLKIPGVPHVPLLIFLKTLTTHSLPARLYFGVLVFIFGWFWLALTFFVPCHPTLFFSIWFVTYTTGESSSDFYHCLHCPVDFIHSCLSLSHHFPCSCCSVRLFLTLHHHCFFSYLLLQLVPFPCPLEVSLKHFI